MRNNLLLTFTLLIAAELYVASAQGGCENGWERSTDRCLSLFGDAIDGAARLTWFQADEACKAMGASLASIKTKETQPIMTALLVLAPSSNVWIGLNDVDEEGVYKWPDGTSLDDDPTTGFTNWGPNQPDNANNAYEEDCVYLGANEDFPGEWFDGFCYYPRAYICEKPQGMILNKGGWTNKLDKAETSLKLSPTAPHLLPPTPHNPSPVPHPYTNSYPTPTPPLPYPKPISCPTPPTPPLHHLLPHLLPHPYTTSYPTPVPPPTPTLSHFLSHPYTTSDPTPNPSPTPPLSHFLPHPYTASYPASYPTPTPPPIPPLHFLLPHP
ncbi:carbohydrate-responsive element-binding protein-like [Patiria miniata]|uniref:C-type lectin domain-containing protein n=1 Tax=Patiria miniata TaxID=46514 RepID=A0A914BM28_PATMI|nr:carbohydrate-responsive element-binding protein-like [Patiria miniata]